jgi:hypothetical protein
MMTCFAHEQMQLYDPKQLTIEETYCTEWIV